MSYNPVLASETITSSGSGDDKDLAVNALATCVEIFNSGSGLVTAFFGAVENVPGLPVPAGERATIYLPGGNQVSAMVLRFAAAGSVLAAQYLVAPSRGTAPGAPGTALVDAIVACTEVLGGGIPLAEGAESIGSVGLDAGEAHVGQVGGRHVMATYEHTRAANTDAYSVGDVYGGLMPITVGRVAGGSASLWEIIATTDKADAAHQFRLHFFTSGSVDIAADNAARSVKYANAPYHLGYIDLPVFVPGTNGARAYLGDLRPKLLPCASGETRIWIVPEVINAGFTPASEQKTLFALLVDQN